MPKTVFLKIKTTQTQHCCIYGVFFVLFVKFPFIIVTYPIISLLIYHSATVNRDLKFMIGFSKYL